MVSIEMPKYKCHKVVHALQIKSIRITPNNTCVLSFVDPEYGPLELPGSFYVRHNPDPGGYYVVYEDGYQSYSPKAAFESGYKLIEPTSGGYTIAPVKDNLFKVTSPRGINVYTGTYAECAVLKERLIEAFNEGVYSITSNPNFTLVPNEPTMAMVSAGEATKGPRQCYAAMLKAAPNEEQDTHLWSAIFSWFKK